MHFVPRVRTFLLPEFCAFRCPIFASFASFAARFAARISRISLPTFAFRCPRSRFVVYIRCLPY
jgi:hypothetical protein